MALIKKITKENRNSRLHKEVEATYNFVFAKGETYIQINTFGSDDRAVKGAVSQTIQISQAVIKEINGVLEKNKI